MRYSQVGIDLKKERKKQFCLMLVGGETEHLTGGLLGGRADMIVFKSNRLATYIPPLCRYPLVQQFCLRENNQQKESITCLCEWFPAEDSSCPSKNTWQCLEKFLVVTTRWGMLLWWVEASRAKTSYSAQDSCPPHPPTPTKLE